jgi:hypothetical protein
MQQEQQQPEKKISRKEAISKVGKYTVFTAASMMLILNPVKTEAQYSPDLPPEWYY